MHQLTPLEREQRKVADIETRLAVTNQAINQAHLERLKRGSAWSKDGRDLNAFIRVRTGEARGLEEELRIAKDMLEIVKTGVAEKAKIAHRTATAMLAKDKWFELSCPDGHTVRVRHSSIENLENDLLPDYSVVGEVHGADAETGKGGITSPHGAELVAYLKSRGAVFTEGP